MEGDLTFAEPASRADSAPRIRRGWEPTTPKIFVAESERRTRELFAHDLRRAGYDVVEVADGEALWRELQAALGDDDNPREADLVVIGARLPRLSGLDVLSLIRRGDPLTPVIVMASPADESCHDDAYRLGASVVMDLPVSVDELVRTALSLVDPA